MGSVNKKVELLKQVMASINSDKTFISESGDKLCQIITDVSGANVETISSGSLVFDGVMGGGVAKGRVVEMFGKPSSGKTTLAISTAAQCQRDGGTVVFIDLENAFDPQYARALGVRLDELFYATPESAEQALDFIEALLDSRTVDLIIVDSVAALVPSAELAGSNSDTTVGVVARLMSKHLRKAVGKAARSGTTLIYINQTRDKIGGFSSYGTPQTTTGGHALEFYASQRVQISKGEPITEGKETIGVVMKIANKKNKIAPPFRKGETVVTYAKGINRAAEMITVGPDYGVVVRPNNRRYETRNGDLLGTSRADAVKFLEDNPVVLERLQGELIDALRGSDMGSADGVSVDLVVDGVEE